MLIRIKSKAFVCIAIFTVLLLSCWWMDRVGETYTRDRGRSSISIQENDPHRFLPREYIKWIPEEKEQEKKGL